MENKFKPLGYQDLLDRLEYKEMLERMSSTTDPEFAGPPTRMGDIYPREPGPTEKFGKLIGKGLLNLPYVFEDERSAMATGQDTADVLAFTPGIGNVLGYLEGQKMTDEGNPLLGSVITGLSAGIGPVGKGSGSIPTPPEDIIKLFPKNLDKVEAYPQLQKIANILKGLGRGEKEAAIKLIKPKIARDQTKIDDIFNNDILNNPNASTEVELTLSKNREAYNLLDDFIESLGDTKGMMDGGKVDMMPLKYET
tara:strand:- start:177 stop:932 length:756 start_codon:yes stop_codon:yes gene_type:complete